jgi:hypothetical protein
MNRFLPPPQTFVAKDKTLAVVRSEIEKFAYDVLPKVIGTVMRESEQRCAALEAQIAELRTAMQEFRFVPWSEGKTFRAGNICSLGGALYACTADTEAKPAPDSNGWVLLMAKPRDGRDGRDAPAPPPPASPGGPRSVRTQRYGSFDRAYALTDNVGGVFVTETFASKKTKWGWTLGVGTEWAMWNNWSLKSEVLYAAFENDSNTFTSVLNGPPGRNFDHQDNVWISRIGLNYRFGDWGKGVRAAY